MIPPTLTGWTPPSVSGTRLWSKWGGRVVIVPMRSRSCKVPRGYRVVGRVNDQRAVIAARPPFHLALTALAIWHRFKQIPARVEKRRRR